MNVLTKSAVAGALVLGASSGAYALGIPALNSSDLVLVVENLSTNATYAFDTGITINSLMATPGLVTGANLNSTAFKGSSASFTASSTLQTFLSANPVGNDAWEVEAGQYNGGSAGTNATPGNSHAPGWSARRHPRTSAPKASRTWRIISRAGMGT
jgi:hypothetical protein